MFQVGLNLRMVFPSGLKTSKKLLIRFEGEQGFGKLGGTSYKNFQELSILQGIW